MFNMRQTVLASRPAGTLLALVLFAGLTAPFVMLQLAHADNAAPTLPCTEGNHNGCTELSPTPPEDIGPVPPNIVLMLDDSGSMAWDFMPDRDYLEDTSLNGMRDSVINSVYYNPETTYVPPPKADGTTYPDSPGLTQAFKDGFKDQAHKQNITNYSGSLGRYWENLPTTDFNDYPDPEIECQGGYSPDPTDPTRCLYNVPNPRPRYWSCHSGDGYPNGTTHICTHVDRSAEIPVTTTYSATLRCQGGFNYDPDDDLCHVPPRPPRNPILRCLHGGGVVNGKCQSRIYVRVFTYVVGPKASYTQRYVAPDDKCDVLYYSGQKTRCVNEGDLSGASAPVVNDENGLNTLTVGQNVANWFSYYRTRMLMAKSGLMVAFDQLDPNYRLGFASINGNGTVPASPDPYGFDDATSDGSGGKSNNKLAVVQPFGDGSSSTQKAKFWNWLANVSENSGTPLRKALDAVGQYYKTEQPWEAMRGDPGYTTGSTTKFSCRASYTILTTDGFWNGDAPGNIGAAADTDGPVNAVPSGHITQYTTASPYSGGSVGGGAPSLADVATHYWERDLRSDLDNVVTTSTADPASWQHMSTFTIGLGFTPAGIQPVTGTPPAGPTIPEIFTWAQGGDDIASFSWPTPVSDSLNNIADLAHAAVNGHGNFFNVTNPQELAAAFARALTDISARQVVPKPAAVNASVLAVGSLTFRTGYTVGDWSGAFEAVTLKGDGTLDTTLWKAGDKLNAAYHSSSTYTSRNVYTGAYQVTIGGGTFSAFQLNTTNTASLDSTETAGLQTPALAGSDDTLANRINYLLGDNTYEGAAYRARSSILGAIIRSEPVYVAGATGNYRASWPTIDSIAPPESASGAQSFTDFVVARSTREGMVYVGANDGMLHAFHAPVPQCSGTIDSDGNCPSYTSAANAGKEAWAFVPRAVYANLGNLTNPDHFLFRPTVDATPVTRDVFFSGDSKWHTLLAGGVGLGGRGVYALDITDPTSFSVSNVLWEFDSDMAVAADCVASYETCRGTDLGYTVSKPNIGRLADGKWVALVANGYFPDCTTPDTPTNDTTQCQAIAADAPKDASGNPYSALFVLDAETGKVIAELKTPTNLGVTSFGLASPVMGDYQNDQVDDVAFAGDVQGNLWRFDLSDSDPANWNVTLVYKGLFENSHQGVQPITTMPRLFADPSTNRFMVMFGTGKYLGVGDNSNADEQAIYGVRDVRGSTYSQDDLTQRYLHETVVPTGQPNAGVSVRCVTGSASDASCTTGTTAINAMPSSAGGWYINLHTTASDGTRNNAGERVVVNPGAIFASNTVIFETLITGSQNTDACDPSTQGAILALNATSGAPTGVSSLGGYPIAGGRISNARTSGGLPVVSALGGGQAYLPGATLAPAGISPLSIDTPIWRRRSWRMLMNDQ